MQTLEIELNEHRVLFGERDSGLVEQLASGSKEAFSKVYKDFSERLFKYGYHLVNEKSVVEDAIHDVFVALWTNRQQLLKIQSLRAYLLSSVRHAILRKVTTERRNLLKNNQWVSENLLFGNKSRFEEEEEKIKAVRNAVNLLTDKQREIIYLRFYQELSYSDISNLLEIDLQHAYNMASKAYAFLKDHLQ